MNQPLKSSRLLSLAAGSVQEFPPEKAIYAAAEAGFDAAGIWYEHADWSDQRCGRIAAALQDTGLCALDLEVVWLHPGEDIHCHDGMIDAALQIGARNVLCVSSEPDITRTKQRFEHLCRRAESGAVRVVLEFLAFTEIKSLQQALEVVRDTAHPAGGILVDALHLQRSGSLPEDISAVEPALLPYIQLCDAAAAPARNTTEGLLEDALYLRQLPAEGELPLQALLAQLDPALPLSLEIRSQKLIEDYPDDPTGRARVILEATRNFLAGANLQGR